MKSLVQILEDYGLSNEQAKNVEQKLKLFDKNNFQTFKDLINSYPHPSLTDVEAYKSNPTKKVIITDIDYGGIDDLICGTINGITKTTTPDEAYPKLIPYLNVILRYEEIEKKHTHKGSIYFNIGQYLIKTGEVENGLYFIHRGLIDDDMKHLGVMNFPGVYSYQLIILDKNLNHPYVNDMIHFISQKFLKTKYSYDDFFDNFLDKPSKVSANNILWLDHIAFFHFFTFHLKKRYTLPDDLFDSVLGELTSSNLIGDLCLLIESICKLKFPSLNTTGRETFSDVNIEMRKIYSWRGASVNGNDFGIANLNSTLTEIFSNSYKGSTDSLQNSFYLSWGLRNKIHHKINSMGIIRENFKKIIEKQMEFFLDLVINK